MWPCHVGFRDGILWIDTVDGYIQRYIYKAGRADWAYNDRAAGLGIWVVMPGLQAVGLSYSLP